MKTIEANAQNIAVASVAAPTRQRGDAIKLALALFAVWVFWGSTFAGMRLALGSIPAFAMVSSRFLVAGLILLAFTAATGRATRITRDDLVRAFITGTTLLLFGNSLSTWCVQFIPTGVASLLVSLSPVYMTFFDYVLYRNRPSRFAIVGMALGFAGMILFAIPKASGHLPLVPTIVILLGSVSWAFGSIYQRRAGAARSLLMATALQMIVGGLLTGIVSLGLGELHGFDLHALTLGAALGWAYLVVFGSLGGYVAYLYTMQHAPTALGSSYAYINPLIAVALGIALFHEAFAPVEALAGIVIIAGVVLMMLPGRRVPRPAGAVHRP